MTRGSLTLGVVIAVPEPFAEEIQHARHSAGDPLAYEVPAHITLLPPTQVDLSRLTAIQAHVDRVAAATAPFDVELSGTGSFRPVTPVVFLRLAEGGEACTALAANVASGPLAGPSEYPYHPHVTLAHAVPEARLDAVAERMSEVRFRFRVTEFGLYERAAGGWASVDVVRLLGPRPAPIGSPAPLTAAWQLSPVPRAWPRER